jgi:hypothetical protein
LASAYAITGIIRRAFLVLSDAREAKKLPPRMFFASRFSQNVCAMVDFPIPAIPTIQYTLLLLGFEAQVSNSFEDFYAGPLHAAGGVAVRRLSSFIGCHFVIEPFDGNCGYMSATKLCSVGIVYLTLAPMFMNFNLDKKFNQYFKPSITEHTF